MNRISLHPEPRMQVKTNLRVHRHDTGKKYVLHIEIGDWDTAPDTISLFLHPQQMAELADQISAMVD